MTSYHNKMRPDELEARLRNERERHRDADGTVRLTPVADKRMKHVGKLIENMRKEIDDDMISWAEKTGVAQGLGVEISDLNPADPESMRKRAEAARAIGNYYGREPQFFKKVDKDNLTNVMRQGGEPMLQTLASIVQNFGADAPLAIASFAKDAPEAAYLGGMMLDAQINNGANMKVIKDVAQAVELRRDKNYKNDKPASQGTAHREAVTSFLGTLFRELPANQSAFVATVDAAYETRARRRGNVTTFDPDLWKEAAKEVLGESTKDNKTYGGIAHQNSFNLFGLGQNNPVVVPPNIRKDGFRDLINTIRPEDVFSRAGYGGVESSVVGPMADGRKPLPMADLRRANLVNVGAGQYWLSMGDPESADPQWVKTINGDNYVLDMKALEPVLKQRRPDLYLGYVEPVPRPQLPVDTSDTVATPTLQRTQRRTPAPGATTLAPPTARLPE
jgi:ABC-type amino acid transport substrate-binding protein